MISRPQSPFARAGRAFTYICLAILALLVCSWAVLAAPQGDVDTEWVEMDGEKVIVGDDILDFTIVVGTYAEDTVSGAKLLITIPSGFQLAEGSATVDIPPLSGVETFSHDVRLKREGTSATSYMGVVRVRPDTNMWDKEYAVGWAPVAGQSVQIMGPQGVVFADIPRGGSIIAYPQIILSAEQSARQEVEGAASAQDPVAGAGATPPASLVYLPLVTTPSEYLTLTATSSETPDGPPDSNVHHVFQKLLLIARRSAFPPDDPESLYLAAHDLQISFDVSALINQGIDPARLRIYTRFPQFVAGVSDHWQPLNVINYNEATGTLWGWAVLYGEFALGYNNPQ